MSSATSGRRARAARSPISATAFAAASVSTPARRYVSLTRSPRRSQQRELILEEVLAHLLRYRDRIVAVEARRAERLRRLAGGADHALLREVPQRVGADVVADLLDGQVRADELLPRRHVDPVEARPLDRRAGDTRVYLGGTGLAQGLHDLPRGGAADDRVVDDDQPLAAYGVGDRVQLELHAAVAQQLARLDERAPHVVVLVQAVAVRDAGELRIALRGRVPGGGDRDHHVGVGRRLLREDAAHLAARLVHGDAGDPRVGARQVHVLEHADGRAGALGEPDRVQPALVDPDELARLYVAHRYRAHDVEAARLRGHAEARRQLADAERADPVWIAGRVHAPLVHDQEAERALELREDLEGGALQPPGVHGRRQHGRHEVGVGGGGAVCAHALVQLASVHEVAVVTERDRVHAVGLEHRLGVLPGTGPGGGVPRV